MFMLKSHSALDQSISREVTPLPKGGGGMKAVIVGEHVKEESTQQTIERIQNEN